MDIPHFHANVFDFVHVLQILIAILTLMHCDEV